MKNSITIQYRTLDNGTVAGSVVEYPGCSGTAPDYDTLQVLLRNKLKLLLSYYLDSLNTNQVRVNGQDVTSQLKAFEEAQKKNQEQEQVSGPEIKEENQHAVEEVEETVDQ